jgi:hypothetical protein
MREIKGLQVFQATALIYDPNHPALDDPVKWQMALQH